MLLGSGSQQGWSLFFLFKLYHSVKKKKKKKMKTFWKKKGGHEAVDLCILVNTFLPLLGKAVCICLCQAPEVARLPWACAGLSLVSLVPCGSVPIVGPGWASALWGSRGKGLTAQGSPCGAHRTGGMVGLWGSFQPCLGSRERAAGQDGETNPISEEEVTPSFQWSALALCNATHPRSSERSFKTDAVGLKTQSVHN